MNRFRYQQEEIRPTSSPVASLVNADNVFNTVYVITSVLSFIFIWVATVLLLRYYSKRLGTAKYWIIVSAPLFYFLSQFQAIFFDLFAPIRLSDPVLFGIIFTLFFGMTKPIGGILFGVAFWVVSRRVEQHAVKDYLVFSAYGIILLFTSSQAIDLITTPYPPFGLATVSFFGLSSFLIFVGNYSSALSIAEDSELRKSIRRYAIEESRLLGSIGMAQMEKEIEKKSTIYYKKESRKNDRSYWRSIFPFRE